MPGSFPTKHLRKNSDLVGHIIVERERPRISVENIFTGSILRGFHIHDGAALISILIGYNNLDVFRETQAESSGLFIP